MLQIQQQPHFVSSPTSSLLRQNVMLSSLAYADSPPSKDGNHYEDDLRPMMDVGPNEQRHEPYATEQNVNEACRYLLTSLAGLGLSSNLDFFSKKPGDIASVVNCLHSLIKQRQADKEAREQLDAANKKLRFENQVIQNERSKLEDQIKDRYTELGTAEIKVRQAEKALQAASNDASSRQDKDAKRVRQLQSKLHMADVQLRQRDAEIATLRSRLSAALSAKGNTTAQADNGSGSPAGSPATRRRRSGSGSPTGSSGGAAPIPQPPLRRAANARCQAQADAVKVVELQQELQKAKSLAEAADKQAANVAAENAALTTQITDLKHDFIKLMARCESLGLGVSSPETHRAKQTSQHKHNTSNKVAAAAAADANISDAELQVYMATEFKVVQARCQQLLQRTGGGLKQQPPGALQSNAAQQQIEMLMTTLRDQDKALSRALASLKRTEAQREAAQQRASAAQQRVVLLEKRLTEGCTTSTSLQETLNTAQLRYKQAEEAAQQSQEECTRLSQELHVVQQRCHELESQLALYSAQPATLASISFPNKEPSVPDIAEHHQAVGLRWPEAGSVASDLSPSRSEASFCQFVTRPVIPPIIIPVSAHSHTMVHHHIHQHPPAPVMSSLTEMNEQEHAGVTLSVGGAGQPVELYAPLPGAMQLQQEGSLSNLSRTPSRQRQRWALPEDEELKPSPREVLQNNRC